MQDFAAFTCGTEDLTELMVQGCRVPGSQGLQCSGDKVSRLQGSILAGAQVAGFHNSKVCCIVPRFQEYEVPRSEGSKMFQSWSKIPRLHASWHHSLPNRLKPNRIAVAVLRISCVYLHFELHLQFLMCKHFGPLKCKLNATFSGHIAKIWCQKTLKNLWHSQAWHRDD